MIVVLCPSCGARLSVRKSKPDGTVDCPKCGQVMALPATEADAETVAPRPVEPHDAPTITGGGGPIAEPNTSQVRIPGYQVLEELGRGGMGVVYKARQLNPPRIVALKMILAGEHADADQLARFRAEAEAIARLTHPGIAQIHQVGEWHSPDGGSTAPFLTLEYVDGQSLARRLDPRSPLKPRQAAALVRQLARAVHYAHEQGIVHRDLKPGNILLTGAGSSDTLGEPKIVDFGLAKPLDGFATTVSEGPQTRTGAILGTPSYMAPEQAESKKKIGPAADIWALGAILYELLTGRPPFLGESTLDTLMQVISEEPEPPRRIRPKLSRDLETICLTCLEKKPERRYPTAAALAKDLGRFLDDKPVKVRPPSRLERLGRWARRRKEVVYLGAGALLALVVVLVIVLSRSPSTDEQAKDDAGAQPPPGQKPPNTGPLPPDSPITEMANRVSSQTNLKQIALGLHNMDSVYNALPPAALCDKAGKPLLSWRVALLPYLELDTLHKQFKLDEPWDSEHNKKLIDLIPRIYQIPGSNAQAGYTYYQAVVGTNAAWESQPPLGGFFGRRGIAIPSIIDGTSNTILVVEAANPVIWTRPDDVAFDGKTIPKFGGVFKGGYNVAMADGSVWFLRDNVRSADLLAALTRNGGEVQTPDWQNPGGAKDNMPDPTTDMGIVSGKVTFKGRPLPGGRVTLRRTEGLGNRSIGLFIHPDGTFDGAGVEPGDYRVTITLAKTPGGFQIPAKYADEQLSGLRVTIRPGQQTLDFDLSD